MKKEINIKKAISSLVLVVLLCGMFSSINLYVVEASSDSTENDYQEEFYRNVEKLEEYITVNSEGKVAFDIDSAIANDEPQNVIESGEYVNICSAELSVEPGDESNDMIMAKKLKLPIWGNWCGPGHGGGKTKDVLDAQCKKHDKCYGKRHYFSCYCDLQLIKNIALNVTKMKKKELAVAYAVAAYFRAAPCIPG